MASARYFSRSWRVIPKRVEKIESANYIEFQRSRGGLRLSCNETVRPGLPAGQRGCLGAGKLDIADAEVVNDGVPEGRHGVEPGCFHLGVRQGRILRAARRRPVLPLIGTLKRELHARHFEDQPRVIEPGGWGSA